MTDPGKAVQRLLFAEEGLNVFAVLDGASIPDLLDRLYGLLPEFECLYPGDLEPDIAEVAPYIVQLRLESEFTTWVINRGWGRHWGLFAASSSDFAAMRRHFRSLLTVHDSAGTPMRFRYYDPTVLRRYLPTCRADELSTMFGPVSCYLLEAADPGILLRFYLGDSGSLAKSEVVLERD